MESINPFIRANLIVIKIGSALLINPTNGQLRQKWLKALCQDIQHIFHSGHKVVLVSSGAIAMGKARLNLTGKLLSLPQKQACAAAGQSLLTQAYATELNQHNIQAAQILLTLNDTENRRRWLNARATIGELLDMGAIPIINENDTVATDEIRYGDNDRLAARTAQMIGADTLILLSDINGLYTSDPRHSKDAKHLEIIETLTPEIMAMGGTANQDAGVGSGGMATKLAAAQIATQAGCYMCIMNGTAPSPLKRLINGESCTWFKVQLNSRDARKQWIAGHLNTKGELIIDKGAVKALQTGKSLLAAGVMSCTGTFEKGDPVQIMKQNGKNIGIGLVNYNLNQTSKILGKTSTEITQILGSDYGAPLIHRDNLVMNP